MATLLKDPMKFLSKLFLFLISLPYLQNLNFCCSDYTFVIYREKTSTSNLKGVFSLQNSPESIILRRKHPYSSSEIKKNYEKQQYFAIDPNSKISKRIIDLEKVFHQKFCTNKTPNRLVSFVRKKHRKNGSIKQKTLCMNIRDTLRFLIKNSSRFNFFVKGKNAKIPAGTRFFFESMS